MIKDKISKISFIVILISGIIYVILTKMYSFIPSVFIPTIVLSIIYFAIEKSNKINPSYGIYLQIGFWLNLLGEYYFYYHWIYYDKVLHFFIPLFITIILYNYFEINSKFISKKILVLLAVLGIGAGFEIFEYFQSGIFNFPSVGVFANSDLVMTPYKDTIWDLVYNCLGATTYLLFKKFKNE